MIDTAAILLPPDIAPQDIEDWLASRLDDVLLPSQTCYCCAADREANAYADSLFSPINKAEFDRQYAHLSLKGRQEKWRLTNAPWAEAKWRHYESNPDKARSDPECADCKGTSIIPAKRHSFKLRYAEPLPIKSASEVLDALTSGECSFIAIITPDGIEHDPPERGLFAPVDTAAWLPTIRNILDQFPGHRIAFVLR
jgi:hypothetical protein